MLRKTMIVLLTAAALTGGLTADAFARGGEGGGVEHGGGFGGGGHMGGGFGGGHFAGRGMAHFAQHHRRGHQAFGLWPWYGYDAPSYPYDDSYSTPYDDSSSSAQVVAPEPPRPACQHSEQTVTVPSENGGTREVTILRC
jgi:hypothetical protein